MNKRFVLTAAGMSAAAIGGSAAAEVTAFTMHLDRYPGESSWTVTDSSGVMQAQSQSFNITGANGPAVLSSAYGYWNGSNNAEGYFVEVTVDLAIGVYDIVMGDTWGDGWGYTSNGGADAFGYGSSYVAFTSGMGSSTAGQFTVVPAPGALALLGLAGVAGIQRRRK